MKLLKRFIVLDIIIVVICGILAFLFFGNIIKSEKTITNQTSQITQSPVTPTSKVWQVDLSFNPQTQQLKLSKISIKPGTANASPYNNSPYKLEVLDKNQRVVFHTDIALAQQILYDIYFPPGATPSGLPQLDHLDTLITIPYFADAQTIRITKNSQTVLEFSPPKELSLQFPSLIQQAEAATCGLLHIVFVSDGYTDMTKFHADVQKAEATFTSKAPFSTHASVFDFQTVDNPVSNALGCKQGNQLQIMCIYGSNLPKISATVFTALPQLPQDPTYTKIVVLVDGAPQPVGGGLILGVANAIGGQFGVFQNQLFFEATATMEVLGHDVGQLYDRYLYPPAPGTASDIGNTIPAPFLSNCTTNPNGEAFWKSAGVNQAYKGCTSQYLYAPAPLDCGSQGSHSTIMSAAGCAGPQFDGVEQYYINSQILPNYCGLVPTSTPTATPTSTSQQSHSIPTQTLPLPTSTVNPTNPAPTFKTFDCQLDPSCSSNQKTLQLCPLKCTPK